MAEQLAVQTLGPLKFDCLACGACCQGVHVEMVSDDEAARIARVAVEMEVADPIVDGHLRLEGGRCVFLGEDRKCGIHARYGAEVKPALCRQFPFVLVETAGGLRAGVDPSSFNTLSTWHTAGPLTDLLGDPRPSRISPHDLRVEQAILTWCGAEGATVASVLGGLCADRSAIPDLPPGFATRLATRLKRMRLDLLLQAREAGPAQREALQPLVAFIETLDPAHPPPWPALADNEDAFAVEVTRRMVFLRLTSKIPIVQGSALLVISGAVALAWACPEPERFGPAMGAWLRIVRAGSVWQSLTPDPATMQWLALGDRGPAGAPTDG